MILLYILKKLQVTYNFDSPERCQLLSPPLDVLLIKFHKCIHNVPPTRLLNWSWMILLFINHETLSNIISVLLLISAVYVFVCILCVYRWIPQKAAWLIQKFITPCVLIILTVFLFYVWLLLNFVLVTYVY